MNKLNALRFLLIFFLVQIIPISGRFYSDLFGRDLNFYFFFQIARYYSGAPLIAAAIALVGTVLWQFRYGQNTNGNKLYYWLRVVLRYKLALAVIAYGLIKLFPLQMPFPSISNLHTNYGDFFGWKIYYHTLGITQGYESFLGAVEIAAGLLLLFRKTTTFGAGILLGFLGNVFAANIAYDAGEQLFSGFLFVVAALLFAYDAPRLFTLLVQGKFTQANRFVSPFSDKRLQRVRMLLKSAAFLFVIILAITTYANYRHAPYKIPATAGLPHAAGFYNVREFKLNGREIPYTTTDPDRWQNVIFEEWATISIKIARPVQLDLGNADHFAVHDIDRNYESAGVGGRHYYAYTIDSLQSSLHLVNKNRNHKGEWYRLQFERPGDNTIVVRGVNEKNDSIYAVLDRLEKKYMLSEGRRKPVKL